MQDHPGDVYGVISLVFWSITLVVSVKYVVLHLRADNDGEGGVMALAALARAAVRPGGRRFGLVMLLGVLGASLFYGDSVITPAISVMSAIEGLAVATPEPGQLVVPIGAAIIAVLFVVQRSGPTGRPVLRARSWSLWFAVLAVLGAAAGRRATPRILRGLSPHYAVLFVVEHPVIAFVAMGAVVLSITGAEALYADMGHFGRGAHPPRVVPGGLPGPDAQLPRAGRADPRATRHGGNPFFLLPPDWPRSRSSCWPRSPRSSPRRR